MFDLNTLVSDRNAITILLLIGFLLLIGNAVIIAALCFRISKLVTIQNQIKRGTQNIMNALQTLTDAVSDNATATTEGFAAINDAMTELHNDILALPQATDVQAEAERLASNTAVIRDATAQIAQAVRDALPTPAPVDPIDPVDPVDPSNNG